MCIVCVWMYDLFLWSVAKESQVQGMWQWPLPAVHVYQRARLAQVHGVHKSQGDSEG